MTRGRTDPFVQISMEPAIAERRTTSMNATMSLRSSGSPPTNRKRSAR
ncbi:MAG: hypothetical protein IRY94_17060 [Rhodospirillaceae bacterium]|nr:hypothetical protein [Rhodospirillaceae bacterium]